jgi:ADP-ribose pyrophosphatase YjhB (NUDIX family)
MARTPFPTHFFVLCVVRLGRRFLVVHERKHGQLFYLPAGRVEAGERLVDAAIRETLEETGVPIRIEGVLRVEHSPSPDGGTRVRVIFLASPRDDTPPEPDGDTLGAYWVTTEELARLPQRGSEVMEMFSYIERGGAVHPLSLLTFEGAPWP